MGAIPSQPLEFLSTFIKHLQREPLGDCMLWCGVLVPKSTLDVTFSLTDDEVAPAEELGDMRERLALKVLHNFDLVPEHLELRPLYNPLRPNLECVS